MKTPIRNETETRKRLNARFTYNTLYYFIFLFVTFSLFFHYVFEPKLYYHQFQTLFLCNRYFFYEFLAYPGGLSEWSALFLFQFFYFEWAGSLILAAGLVLIHLGLYLVSKKTVSSEVALLLSSLPVILLFGLQLHYNFSFFIITKILYVVSVFYVFTRLENRAKLIFSLLFPVFYYLLGGWFYLIFTLMVVIHDLLLRKGNSKYIYSASYVLIYLLMPYLAARYGFIITVNDAYLYMLPYAYYFEPISFEPSIWFYLFILMLVILTCGGRLYKNILPNKLDAVIQAVSPVYTILIQSSITILLLYLLFRINFDPMSKLKLKIDCYADQERWEDVIREASKIREYDRMVNFQVNRAFCHTGDLLYKLFSTHQKLGIDGLFLSKFVGSQIAISTSDLYFDLGHISASRVFSYEGLTKFKYHPKIYQRLVLTNIIQNNFAAAEKFINILKDSFIYQEWALDYEKYIKNPALIQEKPLVIDKRSLIPKEDFFINATAPYVDLNRLVLANKKNRMAVDYLFASFLLETSLTSLYNNLNLLKEAGYIKLPRLIEEAVLVYCLIKKIDPMPVIRTYAIDENTLKDFIDFNSILRQNRQDETKARQLVDAKYSSTYWYYLRYTHPKITGFILKSQVKDVDMYKFY
jgi:hypothetical protein